MLGEVGIHARARLEEEVEAAFAKTAPATAVVLVSDFVFSPAKGVEAKEFLRKQEVRIKEAIEQRQATLPDFTVALVAADSDFDGTYYTRRAPADGREKKVQYEGQRPYYYLVAGPQAIVLQTAQVLERESRGETAFFSPTTQSLPVELVEARGDRSEGYYRIVQGTVVPTLTDAKLANGGKYDDRLRVHLRADLSGLPSPERDLMRASGETGFEVVEIDALPRSARPMTHEIVLEYDGRRIYPATVELAVPRPAVASLRSRYLDDDIAGPSTFPGKTFGLQQLVEGIAAAYATHEREPLAMLSFQIQ